ncbi:hypothetical protein TNCV_846581 [Trichonephila clavipes]|nr:hypothetical protein TNCV_846581 [Trichonephila clavipes]
MSSGNSLPQFNLGGQGGTEEGSHMLSKVPLRIVPNLVSDPSVSMLHRVERKTFKHSNVEPVAMRKNQFSS